MAKIEDNQNLVLATSLLGAVLAVILAGILLACFVLRCRPSQGVLHVAYSKVDHMELLKGVQEVLLVWTAAGIDGPHLAPVVHAFKKLLSSYSLCKVYDYLDITSLPEAQREHLLESPTAWLDSILNQKHIKIIVVGSDGGRRRLMEWSLPGNNGSLSLTNQGLTPHDYLLFPYLLRRLQDRPDLASDYSRVFHIRFSDINDDSAELEGIVSWTRYRIPQHVRALTLALHGLPSNDVGWGLDEPTTEDMVELLTALVKHPGVDITSYTGPWNPIPMNNHVMQIPYTPDNNAKVEDPQPVSNHQQKIDRISQTSSISEELPEKDDSAEYLRENEEKSPSFLNEETINSKNTSMQPPLQLDAKAIRINHSCKEEITKNTCQDISLLLTPPHSDVSSNDDY